MNIHHSEHPVSNPIHPRLSWVAGGILLMLIGVLLLPTVALTAVGVFVIIVGGAMVVSAFISDSGRRLRTEARINKSHISRK